MKNIPYIIVGALFGITMTKSEAISWFRIIEMFRFESFHMYGIIGVAVVASALILFILKKSKFKTPYRMTTFSAKIHHVLIRNNTRIVRLDQ